MSTLGWTLLTSHSLLAITAAVLFFLWRSARAEKTTAQLEARNARDRLRDAANERNDAVTREKAARYATERELETSRARELKLVRSHPAATAGWLRDSLRDAAARDRDPAGPVSDDDPTPIPGVGRKRGDN